MAEGVELDSRGQVSAAVLEAAASAVLAPLLSLAAASPANQANPHAYLEVLDTLREANRKPAPGEEPPPSVQIDTCHQWKGLEAKKVFVLMSGNTWPPKPRPPAPGQEDEDVSAQLARHAERVAEERRLAYVAITRGRDEVVILSPNTDYLGRPVDEDSPFLAEAEVDFPEDDDAAEED
jgi:DNA helicase-2/ATP-dependent DNA helicase PcrA